MLQRLHHTQELLALVVLLVDGAFRVLELGERLRFRLAHTRES